MMKMVYDGWLKLYTTEYDGKTYEILDNHDAVASIIEDAEGKLLVVEQFRPALMKNTLELPAGIVDKPGLSLKEIMAEELKEEANLVIDHHALTEVICFKPIVGFSQSEMTVYYLKMETVHESHAADDCDVFYVHWLTFDQFEEKVQAGQIFDNKTVMAYYYLKAKHSNRGLG